MIRPDLSLRAPEQLGRVHMVGIGGSGMSGIARMLLNKGIHVTGSDVRESSATEALRELGIPVAVGHAAENVGDADTLIVTGALWQDNPEYQLALARGIPVLHRSHVLEWLTRDTRLISVAGAHGKTTSVGMIVTALRHLGSDPSFVNGGVVQEYGVSSAPGTSDVFVIEADESDGSLVIYDTAIALITNVDPDHLDHYENEEAFEQAFIEFASGVSEFVVVSTDDVGTQRIRARMTAPSVVTFGEHENADYRVSNIDTSHGPVRFELTHANTRVRVHLTVPGTHNAINAAGAISVLVGMGYDLDESARAVAEFAGTERRFELHGVRRGVSVFDDYAHHPTEVEAILSAARTVVGDGRIIAVHQPHLFSRTARSSPEFAAALEELADYTVVLDVYGAREDPIPGVTGELVSNSFANADKVAFISDWQQAADHLAAVAHEGDYIITLGCGDVYRIIPQILSALDESEEVSP